MTAEQVPPVRLGAELLERALGFTLGSLLLVSEERMDAPTPCAGWRLRDLLAHMDDSLDALVEAVALGRVGRSGHPEPGDPVERLRLRGCQLMAGVSRVRAEDVTVRGLPVSSAAVAGAGALEVAVHGWDVAWSCGAHRPLPEALAAALLPIARAVVGTSDRPVRFAAPIPLPDVPTPSAEHRLLAFLGRVSEEPLSW